MFIHLTLSVITLFRVANTDAHTSPSVSGRKCLLSNSIICVSKRDILHTTVLTQFEDYVCVCVCVSCDTTDQHMQFVRNWCHAVCTVSSYIHQPCPKTKPLTNCSRASTQVCGRFLKNIFYDMSTRKKEKEKSDSVFPHIWTSKCLNMGKEKEEEIKNVI